MLRGVDSLSGHVRTKTLASHATASSSGLPEDQTWASGNKCVFALGASRTRGSCSRLPDLLDASPAGLVISRHLRASGQERLRRRPDTVVSINPFVDTKPTLKSMRALLSVTILAIGRRPSAGAYKATRYQCSENPPTLDVARLAELVNFLRGGAFEVHDAARRGLQLEFQNFCFIGTSELRASHQALSASGGTSATLVALASWSGLDGDSGRPLASPRTVYEY